MDQLLHRNNTKWVVRALFICVLDVLSVLGAYFFALLLRHDFLFSTIDPRFIQGYISSMPVWCVLTVAVFYVCRLYHSIWRQVSISELETIMKAYLLLIPIYYVAANLIGMEMPRSYYPMGMILNFLLTTGIRFSYRFLRLVLRTVENRSAGQPVSRAAGPTARPPSARRR